MNTVTSTLVFCLWLCVSSNCVQSQFQPEKQCPSNVNPPIVVSIISQRNGTGHWISQLDVKNGGQRRSFSDKKDSPAWAVGVEQKAVACGGIESSLHIKVTLTVPPPPPSLGYDLFPGVGYYKFYTSVLNWTSARQVCADEGAHLVIINSEKEAEAMKTLYARYPSLASNWAWVGLYERTHNEYASIFGDSFESTGFTRWVPSQPDDAGVDECVVFRKQTGGLEDTPCKNGFHFVCEQEIW